MLAVIGLGNPGRRYYLTRHNAGFLFLDYLAKRFDIPFTPGKGDYYFSETVWKQQELLLIKPVTYMNRSGFAVRQVMEKFSIDIKDLLIVYDDFQLPFGTIRFRVQGSDGGHNGIKSLIYELESDAFKRLKIGIGSEFSNSVDFVLSPFSGMEIAELDNLFHIGFNGIGTLIDTDIEQAMSRYNGNHLALPENEE